MLVSCRLVGVYVTIFGGFGVGEDSFLAYFQYNCERRASPIYESNVPCVTFLHLLIIPFALRQIKYLDIQIMWTGIKAQQ